MSDTNVRGLNDVLKVLKNFPIQVRKNALKGMVRAGAKVIEDEAKRLVPVRSGNLKESISTIARRSKDKNSVMYAVTPLRNKTKTKRGKLADGTKWSITGQTADGFYSHMIEFGTSKMKAQPFLRPAESKNDEAFSKGKEYLADRVEKLIKDSKWVQLNF